MRHALVIGGTGMLSGVSRFLIDQEYHVSIIARNKERMERLIKKTADVHSITPLLLDYRNDDELQKKVHATIQKNGAIDLVVAWIHSTAPRALQVIANEMSIHQNEWELFHLLGSSTDIKKIKRNVTMPSNCFYHQIRLGFVIENTRSRWLTNKEISDGVIEAIQKGDQTQTIGQLEPWDKRP